MTTGLRNMMLKSLCQKVISIVLGIFGLFRRVICRVRRGRKNSGTILPVTTNHLTPTITQSVPSNEVELESWDSWGSEDHTASMGYSSSRVNHQQSRYNQVEQQEPEPDVDYFTDMQPELKRATKIKLKRKDDLSSNGFSSRLAANTVPVIQDGELGTWEDTENAWEGENEDLSWEAEAAIKEKRRLEREKRHMDQMRKKQERENQRLGRKDIQLTAVRLS